MVVVVTVVGEEVVVEMLVVGEIEMVSGTGFCCLCRSLPYLSHMGLVFVSLRGGMCGVVAVVSLRDNVCIAVVIDSL